MENASKALIMAGEILIAVLIITLLIYGYTNINQLTMQEKKEAEAQQLQAFNSEYESYNKKLLRGVDVVSVINKAINNNYKYENEEYYNITIEFLIKSAIDNSSVEMEKKHNMNSLSIIQNNIDAFKEFKSRIFDCKEVRYNKESGRINYMYFEERQT